MEISRLGEPYSTCMENRTINEHLGVGYEYEGAGCVDECVDGEIEAKCGCTNRLMKVNSS